MYWVKIYIFYLHFHLHTEFYTNQNLLLYKLYTTYLTLVVYPFKTFINDETFIIKSIQNMTSDFYCEVKAKNILNSKKIFFLQKIYLEIKKYIRQF